MKYKVTSAEASKLLRKLLEEKETVLAEDAQSRTFCAAMGEDVESVRPAYSYADTQKALETLDCKIRILKHAINCFNTTHTVGDTGMTIDQILVYIPQLTQMRSRLYSMQRCLPKQRAAAVGVGNNAVIDYRYANYSVERAKEDYTKVSDELRNIQLALDIANNSETMEFELPD